MLASVILAGLSVNFTFPLKSRIRIDFDVKGAMLMSGIMTVTSCLAGSAGVYGGCNSGEDSR